MTRETTVRTRAKAWTGYGVAKIKCRVDADGTVWVYDSVAGHYTTCHSLSDSAVRRIRRLAKTQLETTHD